MCASKRIKWNPTWCRDLFFFPFHCYVVMLYYSCISLSLNVKLGLFGFIYLAFLSLLTYELWVECKCYLYSFCTSVMPSSMYKRTRLAEQSLDRVNNKICFSLEMKWITTVWFSNCNCLALTCFSSLSILSRIVFLQDSDLQAWLLNGDLIMPLESGQWKQS